MKSFVRFIFILVILSAVVALAAVLTSNLAGQATQRRSTAREKQAVLDYYQRLAGRFAEAHLAVEWQKLGQYSKVLQTSVLIRRYTLDAKGVSTALPVRRLVIDGNKLLVDGVALTFQKCPPAYRELESKAFYAVDTVKGEVEAQQKDQFFAKWAQPDVLRLRRDYVTQTEIDLWTDIWRSLDVQESGRRGPEAEFVTLKRFPPDSRTLVNGALYKVLVSEVGVSLIESPEPGLYKSILEEAGQR